MFNMGIVMKNVLVERIDFTNHYFKGVLLRYVSLTCYATLKDKRVKMQIKVFGKPIRRALKLMPGDRIDIMCSWSVSRHFATINKKPASFMVESMSFYGYAFEKSK